VCLQVKLCDPHLSALEVRFSRRGAIQIYVYLYLRYVCCRSERQSGSIDSPGIAAVSRPDGIGTAAGRYGPHHWPSQLNIVDVDRGQTGKCFSCGNELESSQVKVKVQ